MKTNLYLIEFYTTDGDINFAWVYAADKPAARGKLAESQGNRLDEVITTEEQAVIVPLAGNFRVNTPDANLFIIGSTNE